MDCAPRTQGKTEVPGSVPGLCHISPCRSLSKHSQVFWSSAQSKLPKIVCNFTVQYLSCTLAIRTNLHKWKLSPSPDCSVCLHAKSLLHVVAGSKSCLEDGRYTLRHNSPLHFITSTLHPVCSIYLLYFLHEK